MIVNTIEFSISQIESDYWYAEAEGTKCIGVGDTPDEAFVDLLKTIVENKALSNKYRKVLLSSDL